MAASALGSRHQPKIGKAMRMLSRNQSNLRSSKPEFPAHFGRNLLIEKDFTAISTAICSQNLFGLPLTVPNSPRDIWGMVRKPRTVHVAKITNTVKGVTYTSYYLRRSFRLDGKVKLDFNSTNTSPCRDMTYVVFPDRRKSLATKNLRRLVPRIGRNSLLGNRLR